jgi:hypothetical protein
VSNTPNTLEKPFFSVVTIGCLIDFFGMVLIYNNKLLFIIYYYSVYVQFY